MNICVIPARGGSKRIPQKNIRLFYGKPMIAYAIDAAINSALFDHVVVSTDSEDIAKVSREFGAETPFMRPPMLADDFTPTVPVISHAIDKAEEFGWDVDKVCCIYPGVPLIHPDNIHSALSLMLETGAAFSFPVAEFPAAVQHALKRDKDGRITPYNSQFQLARSQDFEQSYFDAGQFYWGTKQAWRTLPKIHENGVGLVIPKWSAVDINTPSDWQLAEMLYEIWSKKEHEQQG